VGGFFFLKPFFLIFKIFKNVIYNLVSFIQLGQEKRDIANRTKIFFLGKKMGKKRHISMGKKKF
jgi:hypothetical protein